MSGRPGVVRRSSSAPSDACSPARATRAANGSKSSRNSRFAYSSRTNSFARRSCSLVRLDPVRRPLRLAQRLLEVALEPRRDDRPRADERLPDEVLLVRVVHPAGELAPAADALGPLLVHPGERADARADVAGALRVVRLRGEQRARDGARAARARSRWNSSGREREAVRVAADLVQRGEAEPAVERRVLDALRHHGAGRLLPAHDELVELRPSARPRAGGRGEDRTGARSTTRRSSSSTRPVAGST